MRRLVAVLGYSGRRGDGLHAICAARLAAAEAVATRTDAVLLSGWARRRGRPSEAALMRAAWAGAAATLEDDGDARSTAGNARAVAAAAARTGATDVILVTSSWHGPRARALLRAALDPHVRLELVSARHARSPFLPARELACALALPAQLLRLRRSRGSRLDR